MSCFFQGTQKATSCEAKSSHFFKIYKTNFIEEKLQIHCGNCETIYNQFCGQVRILILIKRTAITLRNCLFRDDSRLQSALEDNQSLLSSNASTGTVSKISEQSETNLPKIS